MTTLYLTLGTILALAGFVVWLVISSRKSGRARTERDVMEDTLDDVALGKHARAVLDADPDERERVRRKFARKK